MGPKSRGVAKSSPYVRPWPELGESETMARERTEDLMSYLAIPLAALAGYALGAVWYMSLAKPWMQAVGKTEDEVKASRNPVPFVIAFVGNLVVAAAMRLGFGEAAFAGVTAGLGIGLLVGFMMAAPWIVTNYAFADRPKPLWWIDAGHAALACTAIGAVLGALS